MTLTAKELRIGNLYDHSGRVKKVTPIVIEALFESERFWCKAIPLTEEWLLKLPKNIKFPEWIKSLHELQNWYYWNNNKKELPINL